jgi:hypothetical protein
MIQLTMFFEMTQGTRTIGWSEQIITDDATVEAAPNATSSWWSILLARCNMFGAGVVNSYNRLSTILNGQISNPMPRRMVLPQSGLPPAEDTETGLPLYNKTLAGEVADFGQTDLLLRLSTNPAGAAQYTRSYWLAGIPDSYAEINSVNPLAGPWNDAFTVWQAIVVNNHAYIDAPDHSPANPALQVQTYGGQTVTSYTLAANPFVVGNYVEALGWRGPSGSYLPRGRFIVTSVNGLTFTINQEYPTTTGLTPGSFRPVKFVQAKITNLVRRSWTNHKKGRPFGELRGRARTPTRFRA